jgi:hypothetical protein
MDKDNMLNDLRDAIPFASVNLVGIVISLSDLEQWVRIMTGIAVLVYSIAKAAKMVRSLRDGPEKP